MHLSKMGPTMDLLIQPTILGNVTG